jgi:hypothetical protein
MLPGKAQGSPYDAVVRLAYVCYWNLASDDGVSRKIRGQVDAWVAAGHEARIFAIPPAGLRSRWRSSAAVARDLGAYAPDVLYLRYDLFLPPVWRFVGRVPTAVEINSVERAELALRAGRRARLAFNAVNRRYVLGRARGVVAVTHELAVGLGGADRRVITVPNGFDVAAVSPLPPPAGMPERRTKLVFLGSPGHAWHGVDKIVKLAELLPDFDFEVIGVPPGSTPQVPNLVLRAHLSRDEYVSALASADVGIGSLALHRIGIDEASPLKVREYLAFGLPVVIGYEDTDFADVDPWYLLRLPNREDNVASHAREIAAFAERVRGRRVDRSEVASRIDLAGKEQRRLDFLAELADHASSACR